VIGLAHVYAVAGLMLAVLAWQTLRDRANSRRVGSALFWALLAVLFLAGDLLPAEAIGAAVIVLALLAGSGMPRGGSYPENTPAERQSLAQRFGHRLFVPALLISVLTLAGALGLKHVLIAGTPLLASTQTTVIALGLACVLSFAVALRITGERPAIAMHGARRLLDAIGWAALLPLLLAMLGGVFAKAGVGEALSGLLVEWLPLDSRAVAMLAYALGMALFTMIMGNAFAAFPVISIGIGIPVLVGQHGADPAPLAALGMLAGYCGTLLTPMAANFNIVPAALLELPDQHAVIRAQAMTALPLFACNLALLLLLA
jgi:uncharacterized membrane protein